jgi:SNF2 family DNA or RNA helicase
MAEQLRDYQQEDCDFIVRLPAAGVFNEQRTGKTPTALSALVAKDCRKTLIVCPASAIYMWVEQYTRWTGLPCVACTGTAKKRDVVITSWHDGGLVVSYDSIKGNKKKVGDVVKLTVAMPDSIILDEAHRIRGRTTEVAKAVFCLSKIPYRLALTGTPTPGRAYEIWAILHFLYPKQFSSYHSFIDLCFRSHLCTNYNTGRPYKEVDDMTDLGQKYIHNVLSKMSTNRKRKDVMSWLPDKDYDIIKLPLTTEQDRYLSELCQYYETEHVVTMGTLDRLIRYRQICLDPGLLDLKGGSPKTQWVLDYLSDYPERSVIIFSKFTSYLHILHKLIPHAGIIVGATEVGHRHKICQDLQSGKIKVLLLNIDAGKEALTLDSAEAVVFMDRYPPVGDLEQAEDRFVSTTRDKADKLHLVHILVMKNSYDETLNELIATRATEVDIINNFQYYLKKGV